MADPRAHVVAMLLAGVIAACVAAPADALEQRGLTFARANCARCHAIGRSGSSPLRIAPPLRTLHERYAVESLAEALAEGIQTGHPSMPQFQLDAAQISDLIAYLKSLELPEP